MNDLSVQARPDDDDDDEDEARQGLSACRDRASKLLSCPSQPSLLCLSRRGRSGSGATSRLHGARTPCEEALIAALASLSMIVIRAEAAGTDDGDDGGDEAL